MLEWSKFDYSVTVMETAIEDIDGVDVDYSSFLCCHLIQIH